MKLCNFASLDPKITESGRKGLAGASTLDRTSYAKFSEDWNGCVAEAADLWELRVKHAREDVKNVLKDGARGEFKFEPYQGESTTQALTTSRVGQGFFRRAVLANYDEKCCITGLSDPRLLTASHIRPWGKDVQNRHNPANGLLISATFDRAFDCELIAVNSESRIQISRQLIESRNSETREYFSSFDQTVLRPAIRFPPDPDFLEWHLMNCFLDS